MSAETSECYFYLNWKAWSSSFPSFKLVSECRDPKDDKFLEVAPNGRADVIVSGDADLLTLNPWRAIAIVTPEDYLSSQA